MWTPYLEFPKKISISFSPRRKSLHLSHSRISSIDSDGRRRPAPSPAPLRPQLLQLQLLARVKPAHCSPRGRPPTRVVVPPTRLPAFRPAAPVACACAARPPAAPGRLRATPSLPRTCRPSDPSLQLLPRAAPSPLQPTRPAACARPSLPRVCRPGSEPPSSADPGPLHHRSRFRSAPSPMEGTTKGERRRQLMPFCTIQGHICHFNVLLFS